MKYTSKDICKFFDIKRDTLRHYENMGIIHPEINPENQYRYYDEWDIYAIAECKKYQTLGMSLKDISMIENNGTLEDFIGNTEKLQAIIEARAKYYELLAKKNKKYIEDLNRIQRDMGKIFVEDVKKMFFYPNIRDEDIFLGEIELNRGHEILRNLAFFENGLYVPLKEYGQRTNVFTWGHVLEEYYIDKLDVQIGESLHVLEGTVIRCMIDAGEKGTFSYDMFDQIIQYGIEHNYEFTGEIYGVLLTRVYEGKKYHRYFDIYVPVKGIMQNIGLPQC